MAWTEDDWRAEVKNHVHTTNIHTTLLMEQSTSHFVNWLAMLYRKYYFGAWKRKLPDVNTLVCGQHLAGAIEQHCIFHRTHKFGNHIIETGSSGTLNAFSFFDYESLAPLFTALDKYPNSELPHVPTYYALPSDRVDYHLFVRGTPPN